MADDLKRFNRLNDLNTTQIRDALVIAGRLLPKEHFFGSSMNVRVLEIDMKELVQILSCLGVNLDILVREDEAVKNQADATDCRCADPSLRCTADETVF